jgi:hypothetical protein
MAHYAKVVDGKVINVIVAEPDFFDNFIDDSPGTWIRTSYNTRGCVHYDPETGQPSEDQSKALRANFAGIGGTYDAKLDVFIPVKPYPSWVLNTETYEWDPPIPKPEEECTWDEENLTWKML